MQAQKTKGAQLLGKALSIINIVADNPGRVRFDDIHEETGYSKPTLYRILGVLIQNGILRQDKRDQAYQIGLRFTELAFSRNIEADLSVISGPELLRIFRLTGEAASLGICTEGHMTLIQRFEPSPSRAWKHANPTRRPLHCTSLGKAYLSLLSSAEREALLLKLPLTRYTPNTITSLAALQKEIDLVQEQGWADENEEFIEGNCCIAVPLRTRSGEALGAISVSAPSFRMSTQRKQDIMLLLKEAAVSIALSLPNLPPDHMRLSSSISVLGVRNFFQPINMVEEGDDTILISDPIAPMIHAFTGDQFSERFATSQPMGPIAWRGNTLLTAIGKKLHACRGEAAIPPLFEFSTPIKTIVSDSERRLWGALSGATAASHDTLFFLSRTQKPVTISLSEPLHIDALSVTGDDLFILDGGRRTIWRASLSGFTTRKASLSPTRLFDLADFPGTPQSLTVSADGSIWVCGLWSDVIYRISPKGKLAATLSLPIPSATACLFSPQLGKVIVATSRLGVPLSVLKDNPYSGCLLAITP